MEKLIVAVKSRWPLNTGQFNNNEGKMISRTLVSNPLNRGLLKTGLSVFDYYCYK